MKFHSMDACSSTNIKTWNRCVYLYHIILVKVHFPRDLLRLICKVVTIFASLIALIRDGSLVATSVHWLQMKRKNHSTRGDYILLSNLWESGKPYYQNKVKYLEDHEELFTKMVSSRKKLTS